LDSLALSLSPGSINTFHPHHL